VNNYPLSNSQVKYVELYASLIKKSKKQNNKLQNHHNTLGIATTHASLSLCKLRLLPGQRKTDSSISDGWKDMGKYDRVLPSTKKKQYKEEKRNRL